MLSIARERTRANDAWRDDHSGASAEVADQAYKLGVNIMFYAFNQYYNRHYEQ